jgi:hypothetical protein
LTENEWQSVTWLYIGSISKFEEDEVVFEDSEESKVVDRYWDDQLEKVTRESLKSGYRIIKEHGKDRMRLLEG